MLPDTLQAYPNPRRVLFLFYRSHILKALKPDSTFTSAISGLGCLAAGQAQPEAGRVAIDQVLRI